MSVSNSMHKDPSVSQPKSHEGCDKLFSDNDLFHLFHNQAALVHCPACKNTVFFLDFSEHQEVIDKTKDIYQQQIKDPLDNASASSCETLESEFYKSTITKDDDLG